MDKIQEFKLFPDLEIQSYTMPKNSHVLSARMCDKTNNIIIDILVDLDNKETIEKTFLIFTQESSIDDNMKADYIDTIFNKIDDNIYYVFEKIR